MCLYIDFAYHVSENGVPTCYRAVPRVAGYDILGYKRFNRTSDGKLFSPFRDYLWVPGKLVKAEMRCMSATIEEGLHAYMTLETAKEYRDFGEVIRPVVIPAGTKFYIGMQGDIVAEAMTIYRSLAHAMKGRVAVKPDLSKHRHLIPAVA